MAARRTASAAAPGVAEAIAYAEAVVAGQRARGPAGAAGLRALPAGQGGGGRRRRAVGLRAGPGRGGAAVRRPDAEHQGPGGRAAAAPHALADASSSPTCSASSSAAPRPGASGRRWSTCRAATARPPSPRRSGSTSPSSRARAAPRATPPRSPATRPASCSTRRRTWSGARPGSAPPSAWASGANAIHQERTASRFAPVSSDAKALDGLNVQVAVCDEIASHKTSRGLRRAADRHGQAAASPAAVHQHRDRQQHRHRQAALGLRRPRPGRHPGGRAPVRAGPRRRSGGRPLGRGDLDQGQPVLGPSRPARRHPRHHAPGQEQPRAGGGGQDPAPEPLGRGGRGAVLHAGLARGGRSLARAGGLRGPGLPPRARPRQPDRPRRARHRLPRRAIRTPARPATPPSRAAT